MTEILYSLPLCYAKVTAMLIFLGMLVVAWLLPYNFVVQGAPDKKRWRDLRLWATLLTIVQLFIYYIF
ncbi:MAG TPA: hypothetical protein PK348_04925 [Spirochaetota bacterium]|nr:hypothetical protein [Spirochaetota bacterium]